jgi:hypothetical protein
MRTIDYFEPERTMPKSFHDAIIHEGFFCFQSLRIDKIRGVTGTIRRQAPVGENRTLIIFGA